MQSVSDVCRNSLARLLTDEKNKRLKAQKVKERKRQEFQLFSFQTCIFGEGQVFPTSQGLTLYLCFLMDSSKESIFLLYKAFLWPLVTYASPGWFPFFSVTNTTKMERLHRAASRAITGCLSSSPIPLLFSEASLPSLRVTLIHFTLSSYKRALRLPTSFSISGLARLGVKPRLQIVLESFCVHSPAHASFDFP